MRPDDPVFVTRVRGNPGDRQRRGIGRDDRVRIKDRFEFSDDEMLHVQVFDHRFDDKTCALCGGGKIAVARDFPHRAVIVSQCPGNFGDAIGKAGERLGRSVKDTHIMPGTGQDIGDAMSHQARADHCDMRMLPHISPP